MHSIHLAQRFGFVPDSSSQTVDGQAHFVRQGVGVLLGHKHNVSTSARAFGGQDSTQTDRTSGTSPACLPPRTPWPRPRCRRVARRSAPVCTSSPARRWPPAAPLGSRSVSPRLLCLSPGGPLPEETDWGNKKQSPWLIIVRVTLMERRWYIDALLQLCFLSLRHYCVKLKSQFVCYSPKGPIFTDLHFNSRP